MLLLMPNSFINSKLKKHKSPLIGKLVILPRCFYSFTMFTKIEKNKLGFVGKYILRYKVVSDRQDEYNRIMNIYL